MTRHQAKRKERKEEAKTMQRELDAALEERRLEELQKAKEKTQPRYMPLGYPCACWTRTNSSDWWPFDGGGRDQLTHRDSWRALSDAPSARARHPHASQRRFVNAV